MIYKNLKIENTVLKTVTMQVYLLNIPTADDAIFHSIHSQRNTDRSYL